MGIKTAVSTVVNALVTFFTKTIPTAYENMKSRTVEIIGGILTAFVNWGSNLKNKVGEIAQNIVTAFKDKVSEMKNAGSALLEGIWNGISDKGAWLKSKVSGVVDKIKGWFTGGDGFDTHSPSKWSEGVMKNVMEGFDVGGEKYNGIGVKSAVSAMKTNLSVSMSPTTITQSVGGATYNFYQTNNSPKSLSRLEIYRQSKKLLNFKGV